jgi:hypothetical protein
MSKKFKLILFLIILGSLLFTSVSYAALDNQGEKDSVDLLIKDMEVLSKELERNQNEIEKIIAEKNDMNTQILLLNDSINDQEKMYQILIDREKDISSSLYNFLIVFVAIIGVFVAVSGTIIAVLMNKLSKHQKKIDMVLDSKEFDDQLNEIEKSLVSYRLKERKNNKNRVVKDFDYLGTRINEVVYDIQNIVKFYDANPRVEEILIEEEFEYLINSQEETERNFEEFKKIELKIEDDEDESTVNPEEELDGCFRNYETIYNNFIKVKNRLRAVTSSII